MKTKTFLASIALASLAVAQPLSAATRSADSLPRTGVQSSQAAARVASPTAEAEELRGGNQFLIIIAVFGGLAALLLALSGGKSNG